MDAIVGHYRGSHRRKNHYQVILYVEGVGSREKAGTLVGKKVVWESSAKKQLIGAVLGAHGNNGAVRARFDPGLPGQSLGTHVKIE